MSDILSVIDRRQGYAFEPLVKPAAPIIPTLDPRLDALLMRIDEKYASSLSKEPPKLPVRAPSEDIPQPMFTSSSWTNPMFGSSTDSGRPTLSDVIRVERELPNVPGGEQAFMKMEADVLRRMGMNPETGSRLPSPRESASAAASSDIPMPMLRIPPPVEEAPINRVSGSGKEEAVKDSGNEFNMARVLKYDKERLEKLIKASQSASAVEIEKLRQAAIKARNAWLKVNNLQEFGRASPENVSNFRM